VHVVGGTPHVLGLVAPQYSLPVQLTPPLAALHVYVPPQPLGTIPHLLAQALATGMGVHCGIFAHTFGSSRPQS
jgi:hypothetical protein